MEITCIASPSLSLDFGPFIGPSSPKRFPSSIAIFWFVCLFVLTLAFANRYKTIVDNFTVEFYVGGVVGWGYSYNEGFACEINLNFGYRNFVPIFIEEKTITYNKMEIIQRYHTYEMGNDQ